MIKDLKFILQDDFKNIKKSIMFILIDLIFTAFIYSILYFVIISLVKNDFSKEKMILYTTIIFIVMCIRKFTTKYAMLNIQKKGSVAIKNLRIRVGDYIRNLNLGYFHKNNIGHLINISTINMADVEIVITHITGDLLKVIILSIYFLTISFLINVKLASIQLIVFILASPILYFGGKKLNKASAEKSVVFAKGMATIVEYISGIELFKSFGINGNKFERLENSFKDFKKYSIKVELAALPYILMYQIIIDLMFPILLVIATTMFINGSLEAEMLIAFSILSLALTNIVRGFSVGYALLRYSLVSMQKLKETLQYPTISYKDENYQFSNYDIEFKNVDFSYIEDKNVLKNVNFIAKEGETTALVGESGSGKSTIISLIARFWDVKKGNIKIGGKNINDIKPDSLLTNISMVFQDVYLINDTIYENIKIGNPDATEQEIMNVAKQASCHEFIEKMENSYDTIVGEGGSTLSGGEKQRISIARALLKNAPIILLDEATASLDADNEFEIRKSIKKLTTNKTVIVIAHRLNTIQDANKIIVMGNGEILEQGNHNKLMENKGKYFDMFTEMSKAKDWNI